MDIENLEECVFDEYFDNINLTEELKEFYRFIDDNVLYNEYTENIELTNLRNENYNRFSDIDISKIDNLPKNYDSLINEIKKLYDVLLSQDLFYNEIETAIENQKILDVFFKYYKQLEEVIEIDLKKLEKINNDCKEELKKINYDNIDKKIIRQFLSKYNELIFFDLEVDNNLFDNYRMQLRIKKCIDELYNLIGMEIIVSNSEVAITRINTKINEEKNSLYDKIIYLEDLMIQKSKYEKEFNVFKDYINTLFAYDDTNYKDAYNVYNVLFSDSKIQSVINYFEDSFINERENKQKEETFIYEKFGIKNIKSSLDYISANYMNFIEEEEKKLVNYLYDKINSDSYNLTEIYNRFSILTNNIWKRTISSIKSYKKGNDFSFICTNNQFIDEKHEAILITDKMLEQVNSYSEYQIGFICEYNDNILYITENDDITSVEHDDMSKLKTPKQIEQEFLNFKVCNRIALNGYVTKIVAVYFIYDGDIMKYGQANRLAKQYSLPLIELKKDKLL